MQKVKYPNYTYINNVILHILIMTAVYADHLKLSAIFDLQLVIFIGQYFYAINLMQ